MCLGRIGLLVSVAALVSLHAAAQPAPVPMPAEGAQAPATSSGSPESLPTIHVTTRIVELDVVVSDGRGHPGKGLTKSDFRLTEDGVPQAIDSFTERDAPPPNPLAVAPQLPPNTFAVQPPIAGNGAMTVLVLSGFGPFIRDQLRSYFQTAALTTPTAIFRMDGNGMHLIQGFTADRGVLLGAVASQRIWPPLGPLFHSDPASFRVRSVGSSTQHLAAYLAGIPGRINLIWIGGAPAPTLNQDIPDETIPFDGVADMASDLNRTADVRRLSRISLYTVSTAGPMVCGMQPMFQDLANMVKKTGGRPFFCTDPKPAIEQITATGSHYYTISYHPTNPNWNGAYRRIHLDVTGYAQPPFTLRWSQLITGWADDIEPTLMYRQGYLARSTPAPTPGLNFTSLPTANTAPTVSVSDASGTASAPRRKLISTLPKGDFGSNATQIQALRFATPTPFQVHFTVVVAPAPEKEKISMRADLPPGNFLTPPFRDGPYRNYRIHYWVDPQDLHFVRTASGLYHDDLKTIAIVYRDDGLAANSYSTTTHLDLTAADIETIQTSGFTLDQTLAIPTIDNFFLRAAVSEDSTGHIGALEIPVEWIKLPPQNSQPQRAAASSSLSQR